MLGVDAVTPPVNDVRNKSPLLSGWCEICCHIPLIETHSEQGQAGFFLLIIFFFFVCYILGSPTYYIVAVFVSTVTRGDIDFELLCYFFCSLLTVVASFCSQPCVNY